jgi:hypothetical protein
VCIVVQPVALFAMYLPQIIAVLLESERRYVTGLTLLHSHFQQPMRMLSSFKPDILSMQQLNAIFLNW